VTRAPVAVALDTPDLDTARSWARAVAPYVTTVKVGLELYLAHGPAAATDLPDGVDLFLDLKLHDIPATVAGAARAAARLAPRYLTVHASGGAAMVRAAADAAPRTRITAVTVLTSLGARDLAAVGLAGPAPDAARRLAGLAIGAGATALVCSVGEVAAIRAEVGADVVLITPGIRPAGADRQDQARVATPTEARAAGADLLVVGRPVTGAPDPGAAAAGLAAELRPPPEREHR
jgi:orotidine-5'-phosphate decarboxylase